MTFNPATTNEVQSAPAQELYQHVAAVASVYGDPDNKYSTFLAGVDPIYPQDPYYMWDQPFALPQGYVVTAASNSSNTTTSSSNSPNSAAVTGRFSFVVLLIAFVSFVASLGLVNL